MYEVRKMEKFVRQREEKFMMSNFLNPHMQGTTRMDFYFKIKLIKALFHFNYYLIKKIFDSN